MSDISRVGRRKFLVTAGMATTASVLLKGCLGNPPSSDAPTGGSTSTPAPGPVAAGDAPEVTTVKLDYLPIVESAPLIITQEKGFFAKYGMTGVEVAKQANWASARDNVTIGSAGGGIDGGQWQMPMPHLISEGIITNGNKVPMIDPDKDIELLTVPPSETVQGMRTGSMDAFSTGDPWPYRIVADKISFLSALTAQIWPCHPEEYLAMRADWVDAHPKATKALLKGVMEAQQWADKPENRAELVQIVSGRNYFNIAPEILTAPFEGRYTLGDGKPDINDFTAGPLYWTDARGNVSYPYKSHDLWFLTESLRWGFHKGQLKDFDTVKRLVDSVNREDLWREAAQEAGFSDIPNSTSRGVETFFDGVKFDPENPQAYLNSLKIKRA